MSHSILKLIRAERGQSLLDVGCGRGSFLQVANQYEMDSYGVDISIIALESGKSACRGASVLRADGEHLPFRSDSFGFVTCIGSLEHIRHPLDAVKEIARVLREGGRAFIFVPNSYFLGHVYLVWRTGNAPDEGHQEFSERFHTRREWQMLLEQGGLRVLQVRKFNDVFTSRRVGTLVRYLYHFFVRPLVPLNLSYSFGFVCEATH